MEKTRIVLVGMRGGNINNHNAEREDLINRYTNIVKRWQSSGELIRLFPEKYGEIYLKLKALKNGVEYKTYGASKEVVEDLGAMIWGAQQSYKKEGELVRDYKKMDYELQTDIPEYVLDVMKKLIDNPDDVVSCKYNIGEVLESVGMDFTIKTLEEKYKELEFIIEQKERLF